MTSNTQGDTPTDNSGKNPMRLFIAIDLEDESELFAIGPKDLRDHFLPEWMGIKPEQVKRVCFSQITETDDSGLPLKWKVHQDNIHGRQTNE